MPSHYSFDEERDYNEDELMREACEVEDDRRSDEDDNTITAINREVIQTAHRLIEKNGFLPRLPGHEVFIEVCRMPDWETTKRHLESIYLAIKSGIGEYAAPNRIPLGLQRPNEKTRLLWIERRWKIEAKMKRLNAVLGSLRIDIRRQQDEIFQTELQLQYEQTQEWATRLTEGKSKEKNLFIMAKTKADEMERLRAHHRQIQSQISKIDSAHCMIDRDIGIELPIDSKKHVRIAAKMITAQARSLWWSYLSVENRLDQLKGQANVMNDDIFDMRSFAGNNTAGRDLNEEILDVQEEFDACYQAIVALKMAFETLDPPENARYWPKWPTEKEARADFTKAAKRRAHTEYLRAQGITDSTEIARQLQRREGFDMNDWLRNMPGHIG